MNRRLLVVAASLVTACGSVTPTNPYDPASLSPADGRLQGAVVSEGLEPLPDAVVSITRDSDGTKYEARTDRDGAWGQDLSPGSYFLQVSATGYESAAVGRIRVAAGVRTVVAEVVLKLGRGELKGIVSLSGGGSPEGTTLTLIPLDDQGTPPGVVVGATGDFSVQGLAIGRYKVRASKLDYWPAYSSEVSVMPMVLAEVPELELGDGQAVVRTEINGVVGARYTNARDVRLLLFTFGQIMEGMRVSEDSGFRNEAAGDVIHRTYKAEETFTLADADGEHTVYAQFKDQLGLETPSYATKVVLDRVAPQVTSLRIGDGSGFVRTGDGATTLSMTASDDLAGVGAYMVSTDGTFDTETWLAVESQRLDVALPDVVLALGPERGVRQIRVKVRDNAGNESEVAAADVLVDGLAPEPRQPALVVDGGATTVHALSVTLGLSVDGDDAEEQLFYTLGNGAGLATTATWLPLDRTGSTMAIPWTLASGDDGLRSVCAKVKDAAGNFTEEFCADVTVDRTGALSGSVTLEGSPSSLAGVTVTATRDGDASFLRSTSTDDAGAWELVGVPSGTGYTLTFARDAYVTERLRGLSVVAGSTVAAGQVALSLARGSIAGTFTFNDRSAGEHGGISVSALNTPYAATTSATGDFLIQSVPVGVYEIVGRAQGYLAGSFGLVTVVASQTTQLASLELRRQAGQFAICRSTDTSCVQGAQAYTGSRDVRLQLSSATATAWRASTDNTFEDVDFQPLTDATTYAFTLPEGADGLRTIYVQYRSEDGELQEILEGTITLDTTPPAQVSVLIDGGAAYSRDAAGRVELTLAAQDAGSGVGTVIVSNDATFDEAAVPFASKLAHFLTAGEGDKTVRVQFCDRVQNCTNAATSASAAITLDRVSPGFDTGVSIVVNDGAAQTSSSVVQVKIQTGDAVRLRFGTTETLTGAAWLPVEPEQTLSFETAVALGDGTKTVYAQFADAAGNESATSPNPFFDSVILDTQAPTAPSVSITGAPTGPPGNGYTNAATVPLTLSAQGTPAQMQVIVGALEDFSSATWETFAASKTLTLPGAGSWRIYARFRDAAGNVSATASTTIVRDLTAPTAPALVINAGQAATNVSALQVRSSSEGADLMRIACSGSPAALPWVPYAADFVCHATTQGLQTITAQYRDLAGNVSSSAVGSITYDTVAPGVPTVPATPLVLNALPANLAWTPGEGSADVARWRVQIASNPAFNPLSTDEYFTSSPASLDAYEDGRWFWRVSGLDEAGNPGGWSAASVFVLDRVAPGAAQMNVLSSDETSVTLRVLPPGDDGTANPLDPGATYDLRYQALEAGETLSWETATPVAGLPTPGGLGQEQQLVITGLTRETRYVVGLKATDDAGNVGAMSNLVVVRTPDLTAPGRPLTLQAMVETGKVRLSWMQSGDDGATGTATRHLIYFTDGPLEDEADFERAWIRMGPTPGASGTAATFDLTGLESHRTYRIAVRAFDEANNGSLPSNVRTVAFSQIRAIRPPVAGVGDIVELDGVNLGNVEGRVLFGGAEAARVVSWSDDLVRVEVPASASGESGKLFVSTVFGGGVSAPAAMGLSPKIFGVYPSELLLGNPTFVSGADFGTPDSTSRLLLGKGRTIESKAGGITQWVDDAVTFVQPASHDAGIYPLRVRRDSSAGPVTSRASAFRTWKEALTVTDSSFVRQLATGVDKRVWIGLSGGTSQFVRVSNAGMSAFGNAENVATAAGGVATYDMDFALDASGNGHFCYIKGNAAAGPHYVYYRTRSAAGTWSAPVAMNLVSGSPMAGVHSHCRIAVTSGASPAAWLTWQVGGFYEGTSAVRIAVTGSVSLTHRDLCGVLSCGGQALGYPDLFAVDDTQVSVSYRAREAVSGVESPSALMASTLFPIPFIGAMAPAGTTQLSTRAIASSATPVTLWRAGVASSDGVVAWNEKDASGTTSGWIARGRDYVGQTGTLALERKKLVDDYAYSAEVPRVAATSEGDLSVLVRAGEGPLLRHHLYRATDGILGDDVAGDEISGLVQDLGFASGAGPQPGQILVTRKDGDQLTVIETRLPSQSDTSRLLSASPQGRHAPLAASSDGVTHVLYFEDVGGTSARLRWAKVPASGPATLGAQALATWTENIDNRGSCSSCDARVDIASLPNGKASAVWWLPGNGNELMYCADLEACVGGTPTSIAQAPAGKALWNPRLAVDADGTAHVVYELATVSSSGGQLQRDPGSSELWYRTVDSKGNVSAPVLVAPEPGGKSEAAIVLDRAGTLHVFYRLLYGADVIRVRSFSPGRTSSTPVELVRSVFPLQRLSAALGERGIELAWWHANRTLERATWHYGWIVEPTSLTEDSMIARVATANDGQVFLLETGGSDNRFIPADDINQRWGSRVEWGRVNAKGYGAWGVDRVSGEVTLVYFDSGGAMRAVSYRSLGQ